MPMQDAAASQTTVPYALPSGTREALKWLALLFMTGDHVAKVVHGGYVPVVTELGRIAFPLFALVMACNLAQPGADLHKSMRRLILWGVLAQPLHAWAVGAWLPVNILLTFALAAVAIQALAQDRPWWLLLAAGVLPFFVDYRWAGVGLIVLCWIAFRHRVWWLPLPGLAAVCAINGNGWALLAVPLAGVMARWPVPIPRARWWFYVYYVGHLGVLAAYAQLLR